MPRLLLLRHAKAAAGGPGVADFERDLAPRGERDARRMGRLLAGSGHRPDAAVASPAVRARRTAELALAAAGASGTTQLAGELHDGDTAAAVALLRATAREVETLLVVGHEPRLPDLLSHLVGGGAVRLPTCGLARLDVPEWECLGAACAVLRWLVTPGILDARRE